MRRPELSTERSCTQSRPPTSRHRHTARCGLCGVGAARSDTVPLTVCRVCAVSMSDVGPTLCTECAAAAQTQLYRVDTRTARRESDASGGSRPARPARCALIPLRSVRLFRVPGSRSAFRVPFAGSGTSLLSAIRASREATIGPGRAADRASAVDGSLRK